MDAIDLSDVTTDELEQLASADESLIARLRHRQATVLAELDRRQVPSGDGCRSLVEWVSGRLDVAPETARELVGAARLVADRPRLAGWLGSGRVSFDRVMAAATLPADLVGVSAAWDVAGIRRVAARRRRLTSRAEHEAHGRRYLAMQPNLDRSEWNLWGRLGGVDGRVVEQALIERAEALPAPPRDLPTTRGTRAADALVSIAQDSLAADAAGAGADRDLPTRNGPVVTVFVEAVDAATTNGRTGAWVAGGPRVGPATLERVLCEGTVEVVARTADGTPLALGRASRKVPPRLARAVAARHGGVCAADGCTSRYRLQAHHRIPWSRGGETDPDNLVLLCWYHHHVVVHGAGFSIDPRSPTGRVRFLAPGRSTEP